MKAEEILKREAQELARMDDMMEELQGFFAERIDELLENPEQRHDGLFEFMGIDPEVRFSDYEQVPRKQRDPNWVVGLSALTVACQLQAFAEKRIGFLEACDKRVERIYRQRVDIEELQKAAKIGIKKADVDMERQGKTWLVS